ncbi:hypothetical protein [Actinomadura verrucosospora]|uniref:Uncharacterized protein n=1 Tax=Actinomadura verrucosospora TaxID=46165 RepID=A0A7D3ZQ72_ACTVE|nr:hypothetical protein [Actinomadura verrucosospora]QKG23842.1 hypothetical protein ACTIVE_5485 [Actinomadura verrucosospora]
MNRMHAARTSAPCPGPRPRPHRKPAAAALTTLLATAAALVTTTHAAPASATTPPPVATPPPPEPAAAGPLPGGAPALSPAADGGVAPVTMPAAEVAPELRLGGAQAAPPTHRPSGPAPSASGPPSPLPGTLAGLAPSAASAGIGGVLPPAPPAPTTPPAPAAPSNTAVPAPGTDEEPAPPTTETDPRTDEPPDDDPAGAVSGVLTAAVPDMPTSMRLTQEAAAGFLRANGVRWRSTGGCSDRARRTCTSFDGLRWGTLKGLLDFQAASGCPVTVTGGTEAGHAGGPRSHGSGHKLDIATGRCVDTAIRRYPYRGVRGDGARLYRSPDGALFARERDHWDITFP